MNARANGLRLQTITRELWSQWQQTRGAWLDAKSIEFERQYLEELVGAVDSSVTVIEKIDKLLTKIKTDCE